MTAVAEDRPEAASTEPGRVVRVIGPVVDVEFGPDALPDIHDALMSTSRSTTRRRP